MTRTPTIRNLLATAALVAASIAMAGAVFAAGASTATAPAPAWLTNDLAGAWEYAVYQDTPTCNALECDGQTYGFRLSKNWTSGFPYMAYAGYPCLDYPAAAGTTIRGYIVVSGSYARCAGL